MRLSWNADRFDGGQERVDEFWALTGQFLAVVNWNAHLYPASRKRRYAGHNPIIEVKGIAEMFAPAQNLAPFIGTQIADFV